MTVQTPPKPYDAPKLRTLTPGSWQARVIAECERLHATGKGRIVNVMVGEGPVRWWVAEPNGIDRT